MGDTALEHRRQSERSLILIRWAGVGFGVAEILLTPDPFSGSRRAIALALIALLAVSNVVASWCLTRWRTERTAHRVGAGLLTVDFVLVFGLIAVAGDSQISTDLFALVYVLPLFAAFRFGRRGAVLSMAAAAVLYGGIAKIQLDLPITWVDVSFRMGLGMLVAVCIGEMSRRFATERRQAATLAEQGRRTMEQLDSSRGQLEHAQRVARLGSWEMDIASRRINVSNEMFHLFKVDSGQEVDAAHSVFRDRVHPDDIGGFSAAVEDAILRAGTFELDYRIVRHDGDERVLHGQGEVLIDDAGVPTRIVGIAQDVTEQRRAESALRESEARYAEAYERERQAAERLRELDELKSEFVAMASHELRTPTTVIVGFASTLRRQWEELDDAQRLGFVDLIAKSGSDLEQLVEDVLQVSRIESGRFSCACEPFDLRAVVTDMVEEIGSVVDHDIVVNIDPSVDGVRALGDRQRQRQILGNLLGNATKFAPRDTPIEVRVAPREGVLEVTVHDRGIGIGESDQERLFHKFTRVDGSIASESMAAGSGLGLYIARALVEAQGGTIWVESALGAGAAFSYTVPLVPNQP